MTIVNRTKAKRRVKPMTQTSHKRVQVAPPRKVSIEVILTASEGNLSPFTSEERICHANISSFGGSRAKRDRAARLLTDLGFKVVAYSPYSISVEGTPSLFTNTFGTKLEVQTINRLPYGQPIREKAYYSPVSGAAWEPPALLKDVVERAYIQRPAIYFESALPPSVNYFHLKVPSDVAMLTRSSEAHQRGITGSGVKVVMVDSGFFNHKYYQSRGLKAMVRLGPGATRPDKDEIGHGTAHVANIFATAPGINLTVIKIGDSEAAAFKTAVDLRPDIITCSWGFDLIDPSSTNRRHLTSIPGRHKSLELDVARAVAEGICVVFASGNGEAAFPAMHTDVIAVGGVFVDQGLALTASNFASAFDSKPYPGRHVPDVCGLVGMKPRGTYIMLPVQPSCDLDRNLSGGSFPDGDETLITDGWSVMSGTSAAAPQVAGVCALLKQKNPSLTPREIRQVIIAACVDCARGEASAESNEGVALRATVGADGATGHGLINAVAALDAI
jgi:serine protease AprX